MNNDTTPMKRCKLHTSFLANAFGVCNRCLNGRHGGQGSPVRLTKDDFIAHGLRLAAALRKSPKSLGLFDIHAGWVASFMRSHGLTMEDLNKARAQ